LLVGVTIISLMSDCIYTCQGYHKAMENENDIRAMLHSVGYGEVDIDGLDFDVERHRESIPAMFRLALDSRSIRPALRARNIVFVRVPDGKFRVGVASGDGKIGDYAAIHETPSQEEAETVRNEVERYFLRHFPGRTIKDEPGVDPIDEAAETYSVYVASYAPEDTIEPL